jgi:hypothetical protein
MRSGLPTDPMLIVGSEGNFMPPFRKLEYRFSKYCYENDAEWWRVMESGRGNGK